MALLKRAWRVVSGIAVLGTLGPVASKCVKTLLGYGGDVDFIVSRTEDPGWLRPVLSFLTDPPVSSLIPLMVVGFGLLVWETLRVRRMKSVPVPSGELAFVFGDGPKFSGHKRNAAGAVRRTVRFALANAGGAELNDCCVYVESITPGREPPGSPSGRVRLHLEPFRLPGHGPPDDRRRMLDLAFYDEALPDGSPAGHIVINMPGEGFRDFFKVSAARAQTLMLRAEASGGRFEAAACRLSVKDGRLRLAKL